MTRKDLSRIYCLDRELKMWQQELAELEAGIGVGSPSLSGMPSAHGVPSSPTEREGMALADCKTQIEIIILQIREAKKEVYDFIASIDDSLMRQIINYRCVKLMNWSQIAAKMGGVNSAENLCNLYSRFLAKTFDDKT